MRASQALANIQVFAMISTLVTSAFGTKTIIQRIMDVSISYNNTNVIVTHTHNTIKNMTLV